MKKYSVIMVVIVVALASIALLNMNEGITGAQTAILNSIAGMTCPKGQFLLGFAPDLSLLCATPGQNAPTPKEYVFAVSTLGEAYGLQTGDAYCRAHGNLKCDYVEWAYKQACFNGGNCPFGTPGNDARINPFISSCKENDLSNQKYDGSAKRVHCSGVQDSGPLANKDRNEVVAFSQKAFASPHVYNPGSNGNTWCAEYSGINGMRENHICVAVDWLYKEGCPNQGFCTQETPGAIWKQYSCEAGGLDNVNFKGSITSILCKRFN